MYKILYIYKYEFTQLIGVSSMEMWDSVPVKNFIVPGIHLQLGLVNNV